MKERSHHKNMTSPLPISSPQPPARLSRPPRLSLRVVTQPDPPESDKSYINHLANYSESWESKGVDIVAQNLKYITGARIHICSLAGAKSVSAFR
jgi:uncharacterized protein (UPF0254 family)